MSYTNQAQDSYTTGTAGNKFDNTKPTTGSTHLGDSSNTNPFSNIGSGHQTSDNYGSGNQGSTTGGRHFGDSGDPNTFSNVNTTYGSDNLSSGNYGLDNQRSSEVAGGRGVGTGEHGTVRGNGTGGILGGTRSDIGSTVNSNNMGVSGLGGAGNRQAEHVGGPGAYGTGAGRSSNRNNDSLMDGSGNTMAGAGEPFASGTGTEFVNDRQDMTARDGATYGNFSGGDANAPLPGFRGGVNDPAYQPGQHFDYNAHTVVPDNTDVSGNSHSRNTNTTSGVNDRSHDNANFNSASRSNNDNFHDSNTRERQPGSMGLNKAEEVAAAAGVGGGALHAERERKHHGGDYGEHTGYGPNASTGTDSRATNSGAPMNSNRSNDHTASAIPLSSTNTNNNANSVLSTGRGTHTNFNVTDSNHANVNTRTEPGSGGGKGWQSGLTGLTEEEVRTVMEGHHSRSAVEAHPNPSEMERYSQGRTNNDTNTN
ncbi:hypothetical protein FRB94_012047 [Tulasnella sp. JGI-2019a]|nr:hypothetical protein FRB94_012047 [Tulasnella sp. JGI-2019a]KAG9014531.1 hypothetical protein FRB93_013656 [Tulasnella sp. JGI-2019a]KAG9039785.1 hypothetical protein FRB95_007212 [Tulasnella sp. JGI-2019a]